MDDETLLWRFKCGDRSALASIYGKYVDDLHTLAVRLVTDMNTGWDIVQDVFLKFVESPDEVERVRNLRGFLVTCVANKARERMRTDRRRTAHLPAAHSAGRRQDDPLCLLSRAEEAERLDWALAQLPYEQRETVVLHLNGNMTFEDIAQVQGVSANTANGRYRNGKRKLKSLINVEVAHGEV